MHELDLAFNSARTRTVHAAALEHGLTFMGLCGDVRLRGILYQLSPNPEIGRCAPKEVKRMRAVFPGIS